MKTQYILKLESLAHLLQLISDELKAEVVHEDPLQLSLETNQAFLAHMIQQKLTKHEVPHVVQVAAIEFIEQYIKTAKP